MKKFILLSCLLGLVFWTSSALALVINLSTEFSNFNTLVPVNFGTVEITDGDFLNVGDGKKEVKFNITYNKASSPISGGPNGDLQYFYFNINPNPTSFSNLVFTDVTGIIEEVTYNQKPDGDGFFDYRVDYGPGTNPTVQNAVFIVSLSTPLTVANFADFTPATQSVGGDKGAFTVAAHFQTTSFTYDGRTVTSDFVGGNPVPLPGAVLLLGAGMARLVAYARRRQD
jgi:hypothetical protein